MSDLLKPAISGLDFYNLPLVIDRQKKPLHSGAETGRVEKLIKFHGRLQKPWLQILQLVCYSLMNEKQKTIKGHEGKVITYRLLMASCFIEDIALSEKSLNFHKKTFAINSKLDLIISNISLD
ncbi:MAG TPA: hypothetical protein VIF10_05050 [Methylobacter sp.]|jgi:hypothetical protein